MATSAMGDYPNNSVSSACKPQTDFAARQRGVQYLRVFTKMDTFDFILTFIRQRHDQ